MDNSPIVPGPRAGHDPAELYFRNGAECMQKRVIKLLDDLAADTDGIAHGTLTAAREMISRFSPLP